MDVESFVRERERDWRRLEGLLARFEDVPAWTLGHEAVQELLTLYRHACSDLNRARSYTANPPLLERLNELTSRGYRYIYRGRRQKFALRSILLFFRSEVPLVYRREARWVATALGLMLLGALFGGIAVSIDREYAEVLIPGGVFSASPQERVDRIEQGGERVDSAEAAAHFSGYLIKHNVQVGFLAFSLGALTLIGGGWILFYNGIMLGAVCAHYLHDDLSVFFFAWVGPHGALELPAIAFFGAAGLRIGAASHFPGDLTRRAALHRAWSSVWAIVLSSAVFLGFAGMIEGSFSQFSAKTVAYEIKIAVAITLFSLLWLYLFLLPFARRGSPPNER